MTASNRKRDLDRINEILISESQKLANTNVIGDQSLNTTSENFFRDVFNFVFNLELSSNKKTNFPGVDLIDEKNKICYQITSDASANKIRETFNKIPENLRWFEIRFYFLIQKPNLQSNTLLKIENEYRSTYKNVKFKNFLFDQKYLFKKINDLDTQRINQLKNSYFEINRHSNLEYLDHVIGLIISSINNDTIDYSEDYQSSELVNKIELNQINERIKHKILEGADCSHILEKVNKSKLRELQQKIINVIYKEILLSKLNCNKSDFDMFFLNSNALQEQVNFDSVINELYREIEKLLIFKNEKACWIIISYFFEICDVGAKR